jgi:hypothetical protein
MNKKRTVQMENKMNNFLQEIFYFYANQHFAMAHSPTFDEIAFAKVHMDMAEFSKFCVEFDIKIPKEKIVELFKKNTKNKKDMTFDEFKVCLYKIGNAMNENKKDNIERRLKILNERVEKFKLENDEDKDNKIYNNISNIDNSEMIGNQIEKDQKEIDELEKEYDKIKNYNYKDVFFEFQTHLGVNDPKIYRKKMKGFINPFHNNSDNFVNMNVDNYLVQQKRKEELNRIQKMKNDLMVKKNNYKEKKRYYKNIKSNYDIMKEELEKKKERMKKKKEKEIKKKKEKKKFKKKIAI